MGAGSTAMTPFNGLGKLLIVLGGILIVIGAAIVLGGKLPWLGRLPGDIYLERRNFTFFFPITTSILISVILSVVLYILSRR
jgi:membrane protein implicated in regulation of membrane protease activity